MRAGNYVPEIDGLRALAVLLVLLYHADLLSVTGGFVGVDVFFVISGLLMARLYGRAIVAGEFAAGEFLWRRVRRLLPAYFAVIAAIFVVGLLVSNPVDLEQLRRSLPYSSLFLSNFFFMQGRGYFDPAIDVSPVLHTWSLAVEVQFYLFFAAAGLLLSGRTRGLGIVLSTLLLTSLILSEIAVRGEFTKMAFFLMPLRLWEFGIGISVAAISWPGAKRWAAPLSWGGLVGILVPAFAWSPETSFPGLAALPVCVGTAALIVATKEDPNILLARMFRLRFVLLIGAASYSIYLWHWPIFVFVKQLGFFQYLEVRVVCSLATLLVGVLSLIAIERPGAKLLGHRAASMRGAVVGAASVLMVVAASLGLPATTKASAELYDEKDCTSLQLTKKLKGCVYGGTGQPRVVLWGDSHAGHFGSFFREIAASSGKPVLRLVSHNCPPFAEAVPRYKDKKREASCVAFNRAGWDYVRGANVETVILAGRWSIYGPERPFGRKRILTLGTDRETALRKTIEGLRAAGKRVIFMKQVPELYDTSPRDCVVAFGLPSSYCELNRDETERVNASVYALVAAIAAKDSEVVVVDVADILCRDSACNPSIGGRTIYRDDNHLSRAGAAKLGRLAASEMHLPALIRWEPMHASPSNEKGRQ